MSGMNRNVNTSIRRKGELCEYNQPRLVTFKLQTPGQTRSHNAHEEKLKYISFANTNRLCVCVPAYVCVNMRMRACMYIYAWARAFAHAFYVCVCLSVSVFAYVCCVV